VDLRYFELHDLLCEALIALDAGDVGAAGRRLRRALAWAEADWLATPSALPPQSAGAAHPSASGATRAADDDD
jgi:hypothetical protein